MALRSSLTGVVRLFVARKILRLPPTAALVVIAAVVLVAAANSSSYSPRPDGDLDDLLTDSGSKDITTELDVVPVSTFRTLRSFS